MKKIYGVSFIVIFVLIAQFKVFAGDLNYSEQIDFEKSCVIACFEEQRKQRANEAFEDWQIKRYCDCVARKISHSITYDELTYYLKNKNYPESTVKKIERSGQECITHLMEKWGFRE